SRLREDPYGWIESVSGHHASVGHVDWCYGLQRESGPNGEEIVIFGGVARNAASNTILLADDEESLRYDVVRGEGALLCVLTGVESDLWKLAKQKRQFGFNELLKAANSKNKKAASSLLKKAERHGVVQRTGEGRYMVIGL